MFIYSFFINEKVFQFRSFNYIFPETKRRKIYQTKKKPLELLERSDGYRGIMSWTIALESTLLTVLKSSRCLVSRTNTPHVTIPTCAIVVPSTYYLRSYEITGLVNNELRNR